MATTNVPNRCQISAAPDAPTVIMALPRPARARETREAGGAREAREAREAHEPRPLARGSRPQLQPTAREQASPEVFSLIRRIALQQELVEAVGILQAGVSELVHARVVLVQAGADGVLTSPLPQDVRDLAAVVRLDMIAETARRQQRFVSERLVMIPVRAVTPCILVVWCAPDAAPLDAAAVRIATQVAARLDVLDHFFALADEARGAEAVDQASVFRPEALAAARETRQPGQVVALSPRILRLALPVVLVVAVVLLALAALAQVPSYSRGTVVVRTNGINVIANAGGPIADVLVTAGQRVTAGTPLISLDTTAERQHLAKIDAAYRDQLSRFLFDTLDEPARESLAGILAERTAALDAIRAKTITAPVDGTVSDLLVSDVVMAGEHVASIVEDGSAPSVLAFMPGSDRARFRPGMTLLVELTGYEDAPLELTITEIGTEVMGSAKARRILGDKLADAVALPPSVVLVRAALPAASFQSRGKTMHFFDGMDGRAEVAVDSRSFLASVLPTGD